jgi:hypothetical protein
MHLKILTRLTFNELGRITYHEDIWGIREAVEGLVPFFGQLYPLQRAGFGMATSLVSRLLLRSGSDSTDATAEDDAAAVAAAGARQPVEAPARAKSLRLTALGLEMSARPEELPGASQAVVQRGCPVDTDRDTI